MKKYILITTILININFLVKAQNISFKEVLNNPFPQLGNSSIAFSDIDNDKDQDVLISGMDSNKDTITRLLVNDGLGNFSIVTGSILENSVGKIAFADIDNDDDSDVLIGQTLYKNDGEGNFIQISTPFPSSGTIAFGDFDNDSDLDLILGSFRYTNDGLGNFTHYPDSTLLGYYFTFPTGTFFVPRIIDDIAIADIDNDYDLDIFIIGVQYFEYDIPFALLLTNDGSGKFSIVDETFNGVTNGSVNFCDIDNNDYPDLLFTGYERLPGGGDTEGLYLYLNKGTGEFISIASSPLQEVYDCSVEFSDIDNDGNSDILISGVYDFNNYSCTKMYTNNGYGSFTEVLYGFFPSTHSNDIVFFDIDNDGDKDMLLSGNTDYSRNGSPITKLYKNTLIHEYDDYAEWIYPNPNQGTIIIELGNLQNTSIKVYNCIGQIVFSKENLNNTKETIDLSSMPKGVYYVSLLFNDQTKTKTIIIL